MSIRNIVFGIDVDDTTINLVSPWIELHNILHHDNLKPSDVKSWDIASYTNLKNPNDFYGLLTPQLYSSVGLIKGAKEGIETLRTLGRVVFITSNFGNVGTAKFYRMKELGIAVDKLDWIEASDKSLINVDFLVDDNIENVEDTMGFGILFTRPWNRFYNFQNRASTWKDVIKIIKEHI